MSPDVYSKAAYDFELPDELIARRPLASPADARLLLLDRKTHTLQDHTFKALPDLLQPGDLCVFNKSKVMAAQLTAHKPSGGRVSLLIVRCLSPDLAEVWYKTNHRLKAGTALVLSQGLSCEVVSVEGKSACLRLPSGSDWHSIMEQSGQMPIPPYFKRVSDAQDHRDYQTVFAETLGSIAAPTAGLHFDEALLSALKDRGIGIAFVTLHVGVGTFEPVKVSDIRSHQMHAERYVVDEALCDAWSQTRAQGGRVVAVGSTSARTLETAFARDQGLVPHEDASTLFIYPGYTFQALDAVITNFHLPASSLMMMMSAFAGRDDLLRAYHHAIASKYRFYSYGDGMLIL
jgi:S-adenosylmethionine:tRNA ribosyltransferase-isomerase